MLTQLVEFNFWKNGASERVANGKLGQKGRKELSFITVMDIVSEILVQE